MKFLNELKNDRFIDNELIIVISNLSFFAFIFILGRSFDIYIVIVSIIFSNIGLLLAFIFWGLIGSPKVPYKAIGAWVGSNFSIENPLFEKIRGTTSLIIFIAYPIVMGIYYFTTDSQEGLSSFALKGTLILILSSYFLAVPIYANTLSSNFIDEDSRARFLIAQFSGLIPTFLFMSLLFWAFNWISHEKEIILVNVTLNFNPILFTILTAFFLVFFLLPYFIGIQRAKRLNIYYLDYKNDVLDNTIEAIDLATPKNIIERLEGLQKILKEKYAELRQENKIIDVGLECDELDTTENLSRNELIIYNAYKCARNFDKRFIYLDFLDETNKTIDELKNILEEEKNLDINKETLKSRSAYFKEMKKDINDKNEKSSKTDPVLWIAIISILSPFISQIMAEAGKYLIEYLKKM